MDNFLNEETLFYDPESSGKVIESKEKIEDVVNHPSHYTSGKIEVIDFIEDQKLPYHLGNVIKYISRAGKKTKGKEGTITDLEKAKWYLDRYIKLINGGL